MNIYPYLTVAIETMLKQNDQLPRDEYITQWEFITSDSDYSSDYLSIETLSGNLYNFDYYRG